MKNEFNFKSLFKGFLNAFNVHKGFIPTIKDLALKPKNVIDFYTDGKTDTYGYNKYFSPGRFFVTVLAILSVLTFLATESDITNKLIRELYLRGIGEEEAIIRDSTIGLVLFFVNNPMFGFLLLIIPSSLTTRLVFRNKKYNLAKHFVVNIYCFCFIALALGLLSAFFNQEEYLIYQFQKMENVRNSLPINVLWKYEFYNYMYVFIPVLYYFYSFKNIFTLSWIPAIFKTLIALILSSAIILLSISFSLIMYLS